jgi:uncharacterized protein (TIGR03083 family)
MNETVARPAAPDRAAIRREIEETSAACRELIGRIDAAHWNVPSGNPGWTCGQLAWHLGSSLSFIRGMVERGRQGKGLNPPAFLHPLAYKANEFLVRRRSRAATPESVLADLDAGTAELLRVLDSLSDEELLVEATTMGERRAVWQQLHVPAEHFAEHAPEITAGLAK